MAVTYRPSPTSPPLPSDGIRLVAPRQVDLRQAPACPVSGCFRVRASSFEHFEGPALRAVTLLVRLPAPRLLSLGHGEMVFADDVMRDGAHLVGYFSLDLFEEKLLPREPRQAWLSASLLGHGSPLLPIDVIG